MTLPVFRGALGNFILFKEFQNFDFFCTICYEVPNDIQRNHSREKLVWTLGYGLI